MMVMLITLDIKISITGTTFTSIEFIIRSSKGWGRYLVAAAGSECRRIWGTDQWMVGLVNLCPSTSWRSRVCTREEGCGGTWVYLLVLCGFCLSLQDPYLLQWTMDIGYIVSDKDIPLPHY